jgi:two-component system response regulator AlgR
VPLTEILYLKAEQKYVTARTAQRDYLLEESLVKLESEFADRFLRVHRNCLVAADAVAGIEHATGSAEGDTWLVILREIDERIPVSRRQWPEIKHRLVQSTAQ